MYRILTSRIYEVFWEKALPDEIYIRLCFEKRDILAFLIRRKVYLYYSIVFQFITVSLFFKLSKL